MQDRSSHPAEPMGDRPDRGLIAQSRQQAAEERLKITASLLDCRVGCLVQDPSQILVSFGGATTVVLLGTFILAWTGSHPRGQFRCRRERTGLRPFLGNDLLCRIDSQARHFGQPHHLPLDAASWLVRSGG